MPGKRIPDHLQVWVEARKRSRLSHAQVRMARELGLNPKKLGKLPNEDQESWKIPLPQFLERLYRKQFRRDHPAQVMSIEEKVKRIIKQSRPRRSESKEGMGTPAGTVFRWNDGSKR